MINHESEIETLKTIEEKKVVTITELCRLLNCAKRTAQRRLQTWHSHHSCNHNGKFYTLPAVAQFDNNGLWRYKGKLFSKNGSLRDTVIYLVKKSQMGLDASEIGKLLHMPPHSFMSHFRDVAGIKREIHENKFVYFSDETDIYRRQSRRREEVAAEKKSRLPSDGDATLILVDRIKHPKSSVEECAVRIRQKAMHISVEEIHALFEYHGIEKKTPDTLC